MAAKVMGIEKVDYTSKKTGRPVQGYRFYLGEENKRTVGLRTFDCFVGAERCEDFLKNFKSLDDVVDSTVDVSYNRFGGVESFDLIL